LAFSLIIASFILISMLCFLLITAVKARKYSRFPIHSRLEVYPVPKEGNGKAHYGGSYFEDPEWWSKPRALDHANEVKDMVIEMLFIQKLFQNNRSLWWISYLFHLGIYVLFAWTILLLLATLLPGAVFVLFTGLVGVAGFFLATLGAIGLLIRRIFDQTLRAYTTPQEYFNIILILAVLLTGIISWIVVSPFDVASNLLFFSGLELAPIVVCHLVLLGIMLIYIPLSKMSHYVGKYFSFHKVLWDNDPNQQGSVVNERLRKAAAVAATTPPVVWGAPHISPPPPAPVAEEAPAPVAEAEAAEEAPAPVAAAEAAEEAPAAQVAAEPAPNIEEGAEESLACPLEPSSSEEQ